MHCDPNHSDAVVVVDLFVSCRLWGKDRAEII